MSRNQKSGPKRHYNIRMAIEDYQKLNLIAGERTMALTISELIQSEWRRLCDNNAVKES